MATFTLKGNYASRMLSQYLFGQQTAPAPEEIADAKFIRPIGDEGKTKVEQAHDLECLSDLPHSRRNTPSTTRTVAGPGPGNASGISTLETCCIGVPFR